MKVSKKQVKEELWRRGVLQWLLYPHQLPIYKKIREVLESDDPNMTSFCIDCARQFGKSFTEILICVEECIRRPGSTQVFVAPMKSQANEIIFGNTMNIIMADCPQDLKPKVADSSIEFPNGSRIRIAGTDNRNYENLRGGAAHNVFLDEAGFMSNLSDGVLGVVSPMLKTTMGKIIFSSTPPENLDHDYYDTLRWHEEAGLIATFTIWDDKTLTERQLQKIINDCRGRDTVKFKREFECMRIADTTRQVIPNFTKDRIKTVKLNDPLHKYWFKYVVADWGGKDKTAIIFAHYNYKTKKLIIEDHLDFSGNEVVPSIIAKGVTDKVKELWPDSEKINYICDSNNILIQQEMIITHKIPFISTTKGRLDQMVEKLKDWEYDDRIEFLENALFVANSMAAAHWDKARDKFAQSKIYGHYDHTAAMVYLVRNVEEGVDPVPQLLNYDPYTQFNEIALKPEVQHAYTQLNQVFYNPRKGGSFR